MGAPFRRWCDQCGSEQLHVSHDGRTPRCIICIRPAGPEAAQDRTKRALEKCRTDAQRIEYLLREINDGITPRGRSAKNITRLLSSGRKRLARAKGAGVDLSVLSPTSRISKTTEADWQRLLKYGFGKPSRGQAGRAASRAGGTTAKRKTARDVRIIKLREQSLSYSEIAHRENCSEKTVQRALKATGQF